MSCHVLANFIDLCVFSEISSLCLAFKGQLYGQTSERRWSVICILPKALRLTGKLGDISKLDSMATACYWFIVVWLPVTW